LQDRVAEFGSHTEKELNRKEGLDGVFKKNLQHDRRLTVYSIEPDGNCLFRAVAHQVYGDVEQHDIVRADCMDYMEKHRDRFEILVEAGKFEEYMEKMRQPKEWGDDAEIRAMEELYDRPMEIYVAAGMGTNTEPLKMHFEGDLPSDKDMGKYLPIRLVFTGNNHYHSCIPYKTRTSKNERGETIVEDISADAWDPPEMRTRGIIRRHRGLQVKSRRLTFAVRPQDVEFVKGAAADHDDDDDDEDDIEGKIPDLN